LPETTRNWSVPSSFSGVKKNSRRTPGSILNGMISRKSSFEDSFVGDEDNGTVERRDLRQISGAEGNKRQTPSGGKRRLSFEERQKILRATTPAPLIVCFLEAVKWTEVNDLGHVVYCDDAKPERGLLFCKQNIDSGSLGRKIQCQSSSSQCAACKEVQVEAQSRLMSAEQYAILVGIPIQEVPGHMAECDEDVDGRLSIDEFVMLMQSRKNSLFNYSLRDDMTRPLSEYFIATSHNTYLQGDQLKGASTVNQYVDVITRRGCRCIEIDLWDGDKGPIVTHGHTMCGKIDFEDVLSAIKKFAFITSSCPLVLSIEQHCNKKNIIIQGELMQQILGQSLLAFDGTLLRCVALPSPESLRYKILVKAKVQKVEVFDRCIALRASKLSADDLLGYVHEVKEDDSGKTWSRRPYNIASYSETNMVKFMKRAFAESDALAISFHPRPKLFIHAAWKVMTDMVAKASRKKRIYSQFHIRSSKPFTAPKTLLPQVNKGSETTNSSLKFMKFMSQRAKFDSNEVYLLRVYHEHFLSRIFPLGTRVRSTNFHPWLAWHVGCQMAAMNYQTLDDPMILNEGLFRHTNGGQGYVLKRVPTDRKFDKLTIEIVCGSFLWTGANRSLCVKCTLSMNPYKNRSFFTSLHTPGSQMENLNPVWRQAHTFDIDPTWWEESHHLITFEVYQYDKLNISSPLARMQYNAVPLRCLVFGKMRWLELYDALDFEKNPRAGLLVNCIPNISTELDRKLSGLIGFGMSPLEVEADHHQDEMGDHLSSISSMPSEGMLEAIEAPLVSMTPYPIIPAGHRRHVIQL